MIEASKHHVGIGRGRLGSAGTVDHRSRNCSCALRPDPQPALSIEPADAAAAIAEYFTALVVSLFVLIAEELEHITLSRGRTVVTPNSKIGVTEDGKKLAVKYARQGYLYVWDRATGELFNEPWAPTYVDIMKGVDMKQGAPKYDIDKILFTNVEDRRKYTQVDPRGGANKPADYTGTEIEYCPGTASRNWENDAYSPKTKLIYFHSDNTCGTQVVTTGEYKPGEGYQLRRNAGGAAAAMKDLQGKVTTVPSELKAADPIGRKLAWTKTINDTNRTPQLATAGDLIFKGNSGNGMFEAYNAATGANVWAFRAGARFNQSPISFGYGGKQHIAIISSSRVADGNAVVAANAAPDANARYRRSGTTLFVFKLPG